MGAERIDEQLLADYLIGNLTEAEESRVEDRAFSDSDTLAALEDAEADLIDAYVRGSLSDAERRAFERRFLASPSRRKKVEFARALAKVTTQSTVARGAPGVWREDCSGSSRDGLRRCSSPWRVRRSLLSADPHGSRSKTLLCVPGSPKRKLGVSNSRPGINSCRNLCRRIAAALRLRRGKSRL